MEHTLTKSFFINVSLTVLSFGCTVSVNCAFSLAQKAFYGQALLKNPAFLRDFFASGSPPWFDFACFDNAQHRHHRSRG